jgi:hypothetical protein
VAKAEAAEVEVAMAGVVQVEAGMAAAVLRAEVVKEAAVAVA